MKCSPADTRVKFKMFYLRDYVLWMCNTSAFLAEQLA